MITVNRIFKYIALAVTFFIFIPILISRLFLTVEFLPFYNSVSAAFLYCFFDVLSLVAVPLLLGIDLFVIQKIQFKRQYILFIVLSVFLFLGISSIFDFTQAKADAFVVYNIAKNGIDYNRDYLIQYPFQYGFILFLRCFMIFSPFDQQAYIIFNFCLYLVSIYFASKSARLLSLKMEWANDSTGSNVLLLQLLWIVPLVLIRYIYGFAIGLSICHIALYFYLKWCNDATDKQSVFIALLLLLFACLLKMNYILVGLAFAVHQLFINKSIIKKIGVVGSVVFILVFQSFFHPLMINLIENEKIENKIPITAWLLTGGMQEGITSTNVFDWTLPGHFNGYNALIDVENESKEDIQIKVNSDLIAEFAYMRENPIHTLKYYRDKLVLTWNSSDFLALSFAFDPSFDQTTLTSTQTWFIEDGYPGYFEICNIGVFLVLLTFLIGLYQLRKNDIVYVFAILIVGGFVYHLLFETKAMYVYPYIALMLPVSACGLSWFSSKSLGIFNRFNKRILILPVCMTILSLLVISILYNPINQLEPVYESYTDTTTHVLIEPGRFYRVPFHLEQATKIDGFELQLEQADGQSNAIIHGNLLNANGEILNSFVISSTDIPSYHWTRVHCDWHLMEGSYFIELFSSEHTGISLMGGLVYGNAKDLLIDSYPMDGVAVDLKLLMNHKYPINFYGNPDIELLNFMSWQTYAAEAYE